MTTGTSSNTPQADIQPQAKALILHEKSRLLEVEFADGAQFQISFELLRVYSPSAEVQGHGLGQEVLQTGKRDITITALEPVGYYAIRPTFSDGHDSGLFTWAYLYHLGSQQEALWLSYLERLAQAGLQRDTPMLARGRPRSGGACG